MRNGSPGVTELYVASLFIQSLFDLFILHPALSLSLSSQMPSYQDGLCVAVNIINGSDISECQWYVLLASQLPELIRESVIKVAESDSSLEDYDEFTGSSGRITFRGIKHSLEDLRLHRDLFERFNGTTLDYMLKDSLDGMYFKNGVIMLEYNPSESMLDTMIKQLEREAKVNAVQDSPKPPQLKTPRTESAVETVAENESSAKRARREADHAVITDALAPGRDIIEQLTNNRSLREVLNRKYEEDGGDL
jgi:hypothetical protein